MNVKCTTVKKAFGMTPDGRQISLYVLSNKNGMQAAVTDYGAILTQLTVPDRDGALADVVLGYDDPEGYFTNPSFFGATVGPNANRIGGAAFVLDGTRYELDKNDGENNLHSHKQFGYHKRLWDAQAEGAGVTFSLKDEDGSLGFPGNRTFRVTYMLDDENRLTIHYHGTSDRPTVINFTNHTYFNLRGHGAGNIEDHVLCLKASRYTPADSGSIPTGEIAPVAGTPMDFTAPHRIGERIDEPFEQLKFGGGYDHNWVIDGWNGEVKQFAQVTAPGTDRVLRVYTDLPGVQFYAGNFIEPQKGKEGVDRKSVV